jgi:tRNA (guanine10-N2)-dimethyltransferase
MRYVIELSKENLKLSVMEAVHFLGLKDYELEDNLLQFNTGSPAHLKMLAYAKAAYRLLFSCKEDELEEKIRRYPWNRIYKKSFYVEKKKTNKAPKIAGEKTKDLADMVWRRLKNPRTDLHNPQLQICFFFAKNQVYALRRINKNKEQFQDRRAHLRPGSAPVSLAPRLARACVNMTGIKRGTICDPFCGTGGILIEAGLMGLGTVGFDISEQMIKATKKNLDHYRIKDHRIRKADALKIKGAYSAIVTDPPYGRNTFVTDLKELYSGFLKKARELTKVMVIMLPDGMGYRGMAAGWEIKGSCTYYVHQTLTKKILLLKKTKTH